MKVINACPFNLSDNKTRILWEITPRCNMNCKHCLFYQNTKKGTTKELSTEEIFKIVDNVSKDKNISAIWISGGEPLLRKDIVDICKYIHSKDITPSLSTNGVLLTKDLISDLHDSGVNYIHLSLDGAKASTHDALRGVKGAYDKLIEVMDLLKDSPINVGASFMVTEESIDELEEVIKIAEGKKISVLSFYLVAELGRGATNFNTNKKSLSERLSNKIKNIENFLDKNSNLKIELFRADRTDENNINILQECKAHQFLNITYDGKLGPCPWLMKSELGFDVGSLLENDFIKLENLCKEKMKQRIEERKKDIPYCESCPNNEICGKGCMALQNLNKGILYKLDPICPIA